MGDSHVQYAVNDSLLPKSLNLANTGESFYFTYYKLLKVLEANKQLKQLYLGVSYHSLSSYYERFIWGDHSEAIVQKYFFILPFKEKCRAMYWNRSHVFVFLKSIFKQGINQLNENYSFSGNFFNDFNNTKAAEISEDKRLQFQFYDDNAKLYPYSDLNLDYLKRIQDLCVKKNIQLCFLNTPLHGYYREKIPNNYLQKLNAIVLENQIKMLDLSSLPLADSCYIPDGDHVSYQGATATSLVLKKLSETGK
jgi:hypothetical protein